MTVNNHLFIPKLDNGLCKLLFTRQANATPAPWRAELSGNQWHLASDRMDPIAFLGGNKNEAALCVRAHDAVTQLRAAFETMRVLSVALEYYADESQYAMQAGHVHPSIDAVGGKLAREALLILKGIELT